MNAEFRCRVDQQLLDEVEAVAADVGLKSGDFVRALFRQIAKWKTIPFLLDGQPSEDKEAAPKRRFLAILSEEASRQRPATQPVESQVAPQG
jgi:antitoxin component of RelBE/YafQ-DinJ toxin-antitoxin module